MYRTGIRPIVNGAELDVPIAAISAGQILSYDGTSIVGVAAGPGGNVTGPGVSAVGNVPTWNDTAGTALADSGVAISTLARISGTPTPGRVAGWASATALGDGAYNVTQMVANTGSGIAVGNIMSSANAGGTLVQDSGIASSNVVTGATRVLISNYALTGSLANVPAMSCSIPAAGSYSIRLAPIYEITGTGQLGFAFNFSGSTSFYRMGGRFQTTVTGSQSNWAQLAPGSSYELGSTITASPGNFMVAQLEAVIVTLGAGTLQFQAILTGGSGQLLGGTNYVMTRQ